MTARHLLSGANHAFEEWKKKIDDQPELNEDLIEKVRISMFYLEADSTYLKIFLVNKNLLPYYSNVKETQFSK